MNIQSSFPIATGPEKVAYSIPLRGFFILSIGYAYPLWAPHILRSYVIPMNSFMH